MEPHEFKTRIDEVMNRIMLTPYPGFQVASFHEFKMLMRFDEVISTLELLQAGKDTFQWKYLGKD